MEITTHDSSKLVITADSNNGTLWTSIKAFDDDGNELIEFTFFGKQTIVFGTEEDSDEF